MSSTPSKREKMVLSGSYFERKVASLISNSMDCVIYINSKFYSPSLNRGTECDLVVLTQFKLYCIECKHYNGFIAGERFSKEWKFVSSGKLGHIQNPYLLNKMHIRIIRGTFYKKGLKPLDIENIIVVPDKCKIHVEKCNVMHLSDLMIKLDFDRQCLKPIYNLNSLEAYFNGIRMD